ncbi:MAG: MFS transporter [Microbacteriaceae bacterium]
MPENASTPTSADRETQEQSANLFTLTGKSFFPIAFFGRLPYAMIVVGVLLLIVDARNSYADGGLASAMVGLGAASCGPLLGALADKIGQRPVLLTMAVVNSIMLLLVVWLSYQPVDLWVLLLGAVLLGASAPQLSPMSRARLVNLINHNMRGSQRNKTFQRVMGYESMADELIFVFGPVLVGVLALALGAWSPLTLAAVVTLIFVGAFALHPSARALVPHTTTTGSIRIIQQAPARELFRFEVIILVLMMIATGAVFGSTLTSLTAFMGDLGNEPGAAILYGVLGVGSSILAISVGFFPQKFHLNSRLIVFSAILLLGAIPYAFVSGVEQMVLVLILAGCGIGPVLVTIYSLGSIRGPHGRSNTIMTMLSSGIVVGQASATASVGWLAENHGTFSALLAVTVSAFLLFLLAVTNSVHQKFRRIEQHSPSTA